MTKYKQTIIAISVHPEGENPIFGEQATHVQLQDESGGMFIEITQCHDHTESGKVRMEFEEWGVINAAVKKLVRSLPKETKEDDVERSPSQT
jgi:hypothetical protein